MTEYTLKVRPLVFHPSCNNPYLNGSGKVILPQSILNDLMDASGNTVFSPITFTIVSDAGENVISVGVEEFTAQEGYAFIPAFIMETYWYPHESNITLRYHKPVKGTKITLEPHATAFIDGETKEKTFLENYLKKCYPVLSKGSTIVIKNDDEEYYINIIDTLPEDIISTVDTDLEVEFKKPLDYVEPPPPPPPSIIENTPMPRGHFVPFAGKGYRLGHKG